MDREQKLDEVITAYLKAVEAGERIDQAEWLKRYPDLADDLAEFFASQHSVERVAAPLRDRAQATPQPADAPTMAHAEPKSADAILGAVRYFGDYELLDEIARGGMGVVYKARQVSLNRIVALKMILAGQLASAADVERFHREAEAAANLDHPNIVPIYEIGEHAGQHYYAMGFVEGPSLAQRIASGPLPNRMAAELVKECALAVHYAHEHGVIHRDLKPANILLDGQGRARITDFGLAKQLKRSTGLTASGQILGTPGYMPPEQASTAKTIGPAADIYALGAVLYALLTGRPPFQAATVLETLRQVVDEDVAPPTQLNSSIARDLETICLKCLEKQPERRYWSAHDLADDLQRFLNHEPIHARPVSRIRRVGQRLGQWTRRRPWAVSAVCIALVLGILILAYGLWAEIRERGWRMAYLEAQITRRAMPVPRLMGLDHGPQPSRRAVEPPLALLRQAARIRPDPRLYEEALEVLLAEGHSGHRILPRPGAASVRLQDLPTWKIAPPLALARDGRTLFVAGTVVDVVTGKSEPLAQHMLPPLPKRVANPQKIAKGEPLPVPAHWGYEATGTLVAIAPKYGPIVKTVKVWDRASGKERSSFPFDPPNLFPGDQEDYFRFTPDGTKMAIVTRQIALWDLVAGKPPITLAVPGAGNGQPVAPRPKVAFSADSQRLACYLSAEKCIKICSVQTGAELASLPVHLALASFAFSPDGSHLAWVAYRELNAGKVVTVDILDAATGNLVRRLLCPDSWTSVSRIAYTPDGRFVLGQSRTYFPDLPYPGYLYRILIWEAATGQRVGWLPGHALADGFGPQGEVAVARHEGGIDTGQLQIDFWRPAEALSRIREEGFETCMDALLPSAPSRMRRTELVKPDGSIVTVEFLGFSLSFVASMFLFGCAALFWFVKSTRQTTTMPPSASWHAVQALIGIAMIALPLYHFLVLLGTPPFDWAGFSLMGGGLFFPLIQMGSMLLVNAFKEHRALTHGEPFPLHPRMLNAVSKRLVQTTRRLFWWFLAFFVLSTLIGCLDGVAHFGWLGFLLSLMFPSALVSAILALLTAMVITGVWTYWPRRRELASRDVAAGPGLPPTISPLRRYGASVCWVCSLLAALSLCSLEVWRRLAAESPAQFQWPDLSWQFDSALFRGGRLTEVQGTLRLTLFVLWLAASVLGLKHTITSAKKGSWHRTWLL